MKTLLTRTVLLALFGLALISTTVLTGCETMEGVGEDTQKAGKNIEDAAERNK